jgi:hypothetical protein
MNPQDFETLKPVGILAAAGIVAGLGTLLASEEKLNTRIVIGRAISSAALGVTAAVALVWVPGLSLIAQVGIACAVASLGTSGLERLFQRALQR